MRRNFMSIRFPFRSSRYKNEEFFALFLTVDLELIHCISSMAVGQERTFCVGDLKRKFSKTLATCDGPWLGRGDSKTWEGQMIVPDVQWKFFWPCNLIRVAFSLQVGL